MISSKAVPEDLNLKFRSKFNYGFAILDCLHRAFLKAHYSLQEKIGRKARHEIFETFKMFNSNTKFTRAACCINSNISNGNYCCHYSLLRCLMLWNSNFDVA